MNSRLESLYEGVAIHATAGREHRAALELLTLVMLSDRRLEQAEMDVIRELSETWRGDDDDFSLDEHAGDAIDRVQQAIDDNAVDELIDDIDTRITSRVLRSALFSAARDVAGADDDVSMAEGSILAAIAVRFD